MLDLVKGETERIDSRFLESACGSGNFLVRILQRRDFRLDTLSRMSALSEEGSHFAHLGKHEIFKPASTYPPMTACEIAFIAQKESA